MSQLLKDYFLLDSEITFLNHGSFGATPKPVFEVYQQWQRELEKEPVDFLDRQTPALLENARIRLAEYLGTDFNNLVFTCNATTGGNIIARSLNLGPGDEVLSTNHEYGAMDRTWWFLAAKYGFHYINHKLPHPLSCRSSLVDAFWEGVTIKTKVIFISHITSPTGVILPVEEICLRARDKDILTIVDGAHAPGQIPLNLESVGADFYIGNLHKWLCAPKGSAFLYARPDKQALIEPLVVSWGYRSLKPGKSPFIDLLQWTGTRDVSAWLSVPAAIDFQVCHNWDQIRLECHELARKASANINSLTGLPSIHNGDNIWFGQMAAAQLPTHVNVTQMQTALYEQYHIEIPLIEWNGLKLIRASFQGYNTEEDLQTLIDALEDYL